MTASKYTIALVEPQPVVHEGVLALISATPDFQFLGYASSLPSALEMLRRIEPTVLLVDESLGRNAILVFLNELSLMHPGIATVVWGATMSQAEALQFVQAGAVGVGRKSIAVSELLAGLRSAATHVRWISAGLRPTPEPNGAFSRAILTRRERDVLDKVIEGKTTRQIAHAIGVQPGTVKVHLRKIFGKAGIHSRLGLSLATEPEPTNGRASHA